MALAPNSVFITGCNRGLGLEFVKQFLTLKTPPQFIFATCRDPSKAEELTKIASQNPSVHVLKMEVVDPASIEEARAIVEKKVGEKGLNLLINNAGVLTYTGLKDTTKESMMSQFEVNAVAPLLIVQSFLPLLKKAVACSGKGPLSINKAAIINMSTGASSIADNGSGTFYPYRASKAALNMITKSMSVDLKPEGIICSVILPGHVATDMGGPKAPLTTEDSVKAMLKNLGKLVDKDETGKFYHGIKGGEFPW